MVKVRVFITLSLLVLAALVGAAPANAHVHVNRCLVRRNEQVLLRTTTGVVTQYGRDVNDPSRSYSPKAEGTFSFVYHACLDRVGRLVFIGRGSLDAIPGGYGGRAEFGFTITGNYMTFATDGGSKYVPYNFAAITQYNLRTGARTFSVHYRYGERSPLGEEIHVQEPAAHSAGLVANARGDAAWIIEGIDPTRSIPVASLVIHDQKGLRTVDSAPSPIGITSLRISANTVSWLHEGQAHVVTLP